MSATSPLALSSPLSRAIVYARVSEREFLEGWQGDGQVAVCEAWCRANKVVPAANVFDSSEALHSGNLKIVDMLAQENARVIVISQLDRIGRRSWDLVLFLNSVLQRTESHLVAVKEDVDTRTEYGRGVIAGWRLMSEMDTSARMRVTGLAMPPVRQRQLEAPYGYRWNGVSMQENPAEQAVLVRVGEMIRQKMSWDRIVEELTALGYHKRSGKPWTRTFLIRAVADAAAQKRGTIIRGQEELKP